jgi:polyhydroxyalkanoate synthesis regulator phasin
MAEPADMIVPLLREMRAENAARHEQSLERFAAIERRLDRIESAQLSFRQALTADSLLSKLVTGEFEERIEILERKVRELENQK